MRDVRNYLFRSNSNLSMKLGDAIAVVAQPIARGLGMGDCGGCKNRQAALNRFGEALYDFLWNNNNGKENMQFVITRQIAVEAETPEEAVAKIAEGKTISLSV